MGFLMEIDISALWDDRLLLHLQRNIFDLLITTPNELASRALLSQTGGHGFKSQRVQTIFLDEILV